MECRRSLTWVAIRPAITSGCAFSVCRCQI
jgi:hypothetical protein